MQFRQCWGVGESPPTTNTTYSEYMAKNRDLTNSLKLLTKFQLHASHQNMSTRRAIQKSCSAISRIVPKRRIHVKPKDRFTMEDLHGTSPRSVISLFANHLQYRKREDQKMMRLNHDLEQFLTALPDSIRERKQTQRFSGFKKEDPVMNLFERLDLQRCDLQRFAHFDTDRNYTRNLISTDNETYTLLLLCWNPGMQSPIHDHPCDGCWMSVVSGAVQEKRYRPDENGNLVCTQDEIFHQGGVVFIEDSMGYHSVKNPSESQPAVTLHLYSPPFQQCRIWLDECQEPTTCSIGNYSAYGKRLRGK